MSELSQHWDAIFRSKGRVFAEPHADMPGVARLLAERGARRVLDLGSGSGRHTVFLAQQGFDAYGLDASTAGLQMTQEWLDQAGLSATLTHGDVFARLPYPDNFFDGVVSVQVLNHAYLNVIEQAVAEIERVLTPGGLIFVTVATAKNQAEKFEELAPNTFLPLDGPEEGLVHYFFDEAQMRRSFGHFDVLDIHLDPRHHMCFLATLR